MWVWEQARWAPWTPENDYYFSPLPYQRTGPGRALDGGAKFDLTKFNQAYFDRLRSRVIEARDRGIYVSIMLFQGWSIEKKRPYATANNPWRGHPFNVNNNINGVNGDSDGDGDGGETHTLASPAVTAVQEAYVRKVIDTVNDLDNVMYEIVNESTTNLSAGGADLWMKHLIDYILAYELNNKPRQHVIHYGEAWGPQDKYGNNAHVIQRGDKLDPFLNDGRKIIISDTDHIWGVGGTYDWVWKSFLRGLNPIYMDPYDKSIDPADFQAVQGSREGILKAMGDTLTYARRINLAAMVPREDLCSTRYCLVNPGEEYLIYVPNSKRTFGMRTLDRLRLQKSVGWLTRLMGWNETVTVDLSAARKAFQVEWFNPRIGDIVAGPMIRGGAYKEFTAPFQGDAVLYITSTNHNL